MFAYMAQSLRIRQLRRLIARAVALVAVVALAAASTAYADYGNVWLNWANTGANGLQWTGNTSLRQAAAESNSYNWGCANMWVTSGSGHWVFSVSYCGAAKVQGTTPAFGHGSGVWSEAVAWNDSGASQLMWGWRWIETCC